MSNHQHFTVDAGSMGVATFGLDKPLTVVYRNRHEYETTKYCKSISQSWCPSINLSENWDALCYPFIHISSPDTVEDIQDGSEYRKLMEPGEFLSVPEHTGLILCSDGVPLFKSSGQSLWPILLSLTSFPPEIRMNADFLFLAGVWLGSTKPDMKLILEPVLDRINNLDVPIDTPIGRKHLKTKLLLAVFDLPAKAMALNSIQFNGKYGCNYCLDEGVHISHRHLYPPNGTHNPRTAQHIKKSAKKAEKRKVPVYGIKGCSVLSPYIDIVKSVPVDYMHAVLEGVTRTLFTCWFDSKNHGQAFYLGKSIAAINRSLLRIKPPHDFRRSPRPLSTYKYWKASELRAWLLFYSIPLLSNLLHPDYLGHLSLLVCSMHILLGSCISSSEREMAHLMLTRFYELLPQLYSPNVCTANAHSLIHLCQFVHYWGPLWCYSTFGFENMNGYLKKRCHGTRNVLPQLIHAIRVRQTLPILQNNLVKSENKATMGFLKKLCGKNTHGTGALGRVVHKQLLSEELLALTEAGFSISGGVFPVFPRYKNKSFFISHKPSTKRNSSVCRIILPSGQTCFGSINKFCFTNGVPVAIVSVFEELREGSILNEQTELSSLTTDDHEAAKCISLFLFRVKKLSLTHKIIAISPNNIVQKCIHIPIKYSPTDFIVTQPNITDSIPLLFATTKYIIIVKTAYKILPRLLPRS